MSKYFSGGCVVWKSTPKETIRYIDLSGLCGSRKCELSGDQIERVINLIVEGC